MQDSDRKISKNSPGVVSLDPHGGRGPPLSAPSPSYPMLPYPPNIFDNPPPLVNQRQHVAITLPAVGERSSVMSLSVCLSLSVSVESLVRTLRNFLYMLRHLASV